MANRKGTGLGTHTLRTTTSALPAAPVPPHPPQTEPPPLQRLPTHPKPPTNPLPAVRIFSHSTRTENNRALIVIFDKRLRAIRIHRGLSQENLADRAHMHRTHISLTETGTRDIRLTTICALAAALRVNPGELMPILFPPDPAPRSTPIIPPPP